MSEVGKDNGEEVEILDGTKAGSTSPLQNNLQNCDQAGSNQ